MSSMDAIYHASKDLINELQNPAHTIPLVKLGPRHKEALKILADILSKANPPAVLLRVPVRELGQKKL